MAAIYDQMMLEKKMHEADSIADRIRDLEWRIATDGVDLHDDRRKAVDKLRHVKKEIYDIKLRILKGEANG